MRLIPQTDPEAIEALGSSLPLYQLKSARWVPERALLVNADFHFDAALASMEGPALEYSRRTQTNQQRAQALAHMPAVDLAVAFHDAAEPPALRAVYAAWTDAQVQVSAFGLLFGDPGARVQAVVDVAQDQRTRQRYMVVSEARQLEGDASWLEDQGVRLAQFLRASAQQLLALAAAHPAPLPTGGREVTCSVGGSQQARGHVLSETEGFVDLVVSDKPVALMRCPREAVGQVAEAQVPTLP